MDKTAPPPTIILYTSRGDWGAFLIYPYLFNTQGEWIGWATPQKEIYNVDGAYVGVISADQRILRKRAMDSLPPRRTVPASAPKKIRLPSSIPLPPQMTAISYDMLDVLDDKPELLHTPDTGEFRPDAD